MKCELSADRARSCQSPLDYSFRSGRSGARSPARWRIRDTRDFRVGHRAHDGADLHLLVALHRGLGRTAILLAPDEGDFASRLRVIGVEHGEREHTLLVRAVPTPGG